jgi:hypothetical protein
MGRQPSGEIRLAEREDDAPVAAPAPAPAAVERPPAAQAPAPAEAPRLRNHESSPVLKSLGITVPPAEDDEPPF